MNYYAYSNASCHELFKLSKYITFTSYRLHFGKLKYYIKNKKTLFMNVLNKNCNIRKKLKKVILHAEQNCFKTLSFNHPAKL